MNPSRPFHVPAVAVLAAVVALGPALRAQTDSKETGRSTPTDSTQHTANDDTSAERRSPTPGSAKETGPEVGGSTSQEPSGPTTKALRARATSIRKALEQDPTTAREHVEVVAHAGTITIRGKISTRAMKRKIERLVKDAAPDANLKFDLTAPEE